ncbi:MAG TPA: anti-sigma factor [Solirubrobacterales bacterium]
MSEPRDEISTYLLGELDSDEAADFERRMSADAALRDEVERLRPVVGRLTGLPDDVWEPLEPPPLDMPADAEAAGRTRSRRRRWWSMPEALTIRPALAAALSALLLAVGIGAGALLGGDDGVTDTQAELALSRIDDGPPGAEGRVLVTTGGERATVDVRGLRPADPKHFYELWLLDADGRMIALGSFRVGEDGRADVEIPIPVEPSRYQFFDVSLQEDNGDPRHSGVSVLRGPTSS